MRDVTVKFAYKAGFRRAWAIISIIWLVLVLFMTTRFASVDWLEVAMIGVLPVIGLYLVGAAFVWIVEGFAKPDR
jgi:uncharacterized membrane protein